VIQQLFGFAFKEYSKQVDDYGQVYDDADRVYPYAKVNEDANARAQSVAQREDGKGKTPPAHRKHTRDGAHPQSDCYVVVQVRRITAEQQKSHEQDV